MSLAKWFLLAGAACIVVVIALAIPEELGVGLTDRGPIADTIEQRLIDDAVAHEEWYLAYGRWVDLLTGLSFAFLALAVPLLKNIGRARHTMVLGAAVAALGDVIDLSQLIGIDIARVALANDLATDFTAANVFRVAINTTSTFVWVAGMLVLAVGLLILAKDTPRGGYEIATLLFAAALIATSLTDLFYGGQIWFDLSQYALAALGLVWVYLTYRMADATSPVAT